MSNNSKNAGHHSGHEYFLSNRKDFEFGLIEIIDSAEVERMLDEGMYANRPIGQRLGGTIDESALRHYRVGFDHYGSFDVICLEVRIERIRAMCQTGDSRTALSVGTPAEGARADKKTVIGK